MPHIGCDLTEKFLPRVEFDDADRERLEQKSGSTAAKLRVFRGVRSFGAGDTLSGAHFCQWLASRATGQLLARACQETGGG